MVNIKIIDNFLNKDDFNELCSLNIKNVKSNCVDVYNNFIDKNGSIKGSLIKESTIKRLFENYHLSEPPIFLSNNSRDLIFFKNLIGS